MPTEKILPIEDEYILIELEDGTVLGDQNGNPLGFPKKQEAK